MTNLKEKLLSTNLFIENEYLEAYIKLINDNSNTISEKYKTQNHHIIPRYVYKELNIDIDNSLQNIIILLFKDHILAHYYLALCSADSKGRYANELAILRMIGDCNLPLKDKEWIKNLDKYQYLYEDAQINNRNAHLGKSSWNKGKSYTVGPMSEDRKLKIRDRALGRYNNHVWIHKDTFNKHIDSKDLDTYLNNGFKIGRNDPDAYEKISKSLKKNPSNGMKGKSQTDFQKAQVSKKLKNVPKSSNACANMSHAKKGKILISNKELNKSFYINPNELDFYELKGFYKGRLSK